MIRNILITGLLIILLPPVFAQNIQLELLMPGSNYSPGRPFFLDLYINNSGEALYGARLYVALTLGSDDYWFYPTWQKYPSSVAWEDLDITEYYQVTNRIIPEFAWPNGAGAFNGAGFIAAVLHNGSLVSNVAEATFGWAVGIPPDMAYIPPGTFVMGSPEDEPCRWSNEGPQHQVTLTRGFHMMTTEVMRQMWADLKAVQPTLPSDPSDTSTSPTMNHPVQRNTWYEAVLFANLMSLRDGYTLCYYKDAGFTTPVDATNYTSGSFYCNFNATGYRLPTEAEWEYAARSGMTGPFSTHEPNFGSANCNTCSPNPPLPVLDSIAWWCGNAGGTAHPVGTKLPNPWGVYDMHGNVWERCWDWSNMYPSGSVTDPTGPSTGSGRVVRGGYWSSSARGCRSADRVTDTPGGRGNSLGFRLLRTTD